ncbi:trifunctional serine/threonine-protein kinase/ATP-binding protein/sensor histidine kinase [Roseofilum casamattae]|uniref:histidine kinase n=1 Tax=Roseofilum casamattae BLCC-M143 TaxID=3022442 RepID=A0ABT7BWC6_9CYAN|nr:ATP-binding sensor histidine kinase [Roseofilum casamattae]MDJ1183112.1 AAA family ATPase [Roseofilum casamattae BLCC-M143]
MSLASQPNIPCYEFTNLIYESERTLVYRGRNIQNAQQIVLKLMRKEYPSFSELAHFPHQYAIAKNLNVEGIVKPIALERYENRYVLIMEDFGGISLEEYSQDAPIATAEFLAIALQIAAILDRLHQNCVIHKDLKPANILIHPETREVRLIDFSIASLLPKEIQGIQTPNVLEGTLAYISPEQTGRMNRGIDYRSDFYSLGVTFYQLLTGRLPFESDDPMELVHAHIAKKPPLISHQLSIPKPLTEIAMKLMAKNAEDRYQSALGLKYDLEKCLRQWDATGKIAAFALGEQDRSDRFLIPEKLYGREKEVQNLLEAFDRIANPESERRTEMILVAGFSGIGKTAIVNEVHKPIIAQRGYFIKGKFDQFNRNIPFSAFVQAFRDLMRQLLSESDAQLEEWKTQILAALGESGQVLIEVIPELEAIVGRQPSVPELEGNAAQNRFNLLLQKCIGVLAVPQHPLTIFLDDLQWADSASLNLIKVLIGDSKHGYLLLLGAYRDNEVFPAHPLMLSLAELEEAGAAISTIVLKSLDLDQINQWVAETLICDRLSARPLTEFTYQKTKGNPFFTTQFLKGLYEDSLIIFNAKNDCWECDLNKIRDASLNDNVADFMAKRLQKISVPTQNILKLAACIGNSFDLETLAIVSQQSIAKSAGDLWQGLQEGLILPIDKNYTLFQETTVREELEPSIELLSARYRFLHDRVQQAAYSLISEEQKQESHLKIGRLLWQNTPESQQEQALFNIIGQMNLGAESIADQEEKDKLARLNWRGAQKAKNATAYQAMFDYCLKGYQLLGEAAWTRDYQLTLNLATGATEAAYLQSDFETMEDWLERTMSRARSPLDRVKLYEIKIQSSMVRNQFSQSLAAGLEILALLGIEFPEFPSQEDIQKALAQTAQMCEQYTFAEILALPPIEDEIKIATLRLLCLIFPASANANPNLFPLILTQQMQLCLKHGNSDFSAYAYLNYGLLLGNIVEDLDGAYQFGRLGLDYLEQSGNCTLKSKIWMTFFTFISLWQEHQRNSIEPCLEAYTTGLEVGDFESAGFAANVYCCSLLLTGNFLSEYVKKIQIYGEFCRKTKAKIVLDQLEMQYQFALNLLGGSPQPHCLSGRAYDLETRLPQHYEANSVGAIMVCQTLRMWLCILFDRPQEAIAYAEAAEPYFVSLKSVAFYPVFLYYEALAHLAIWQDADGETQARIEERIGKIQTLFSHWAARAPMNYQHKWEAIEAEKQRVLGDRAAAIDAYDRAIAGAKENEYIQEEALANELAAKFYLEWGKTIIAETYLQKAYYCYAQWGAKAKTNDLEQRYPQLLKPIVQSDRQSLSLSTSLPKLPDNSHYQTTNITNFSEILDSSSLLKASQTLSGEIELEGLLSTLMKIILENAGATKGALLLTDERRLMVEAIATRTDSDGELKLDVLHQSILLENYPDLPSGLINYVQHTTETTLLDAETAQDQFPADRYLLNSPLQSLLCFPLLERGNLIGILYLENNLTADAFTRDRVEILDALCVQAAISLENAKLYQQAQQALQDLKEAQLQLVQNEKMAILGNLVAGVAHEINNPVGFIGGNISVAQDYLQDLLHILALYQENTTLPEEIGTEIEELDADFITEDFPNLIASMKVGCDRIRYISTSLRTFSRTDMDRPTDFNLHEGIDSTLLILKYRLKANENRPAIKIIKDYGDIPRVQCYPGQINQVFMNLLANAIDALEESNEGKEFAEIKIASNEIRIATELNDNGTQVIIKIADNGMGMSAAVQTKIFEQGFTTKGVGKGTGLGMAIAHQIVTEKHGGAIACTSELGRGSIFKIALPT